MKNQCEICWYEWLPRKIKRSRRCPCCNSLQWDGKGKRSYKFDTVEINQHKIIQWVFGADGLPDPKEGNKTLSALKHYEIRSGRKFLCEPTYQGLKIIRIQ
jgi:hypothetical protein